ncbi:MAG: AMP-binding protein [Burkholderiaceae bacterium]
MSASYLHGERPLHEYLRHHARARPDQAAFLWYGRPISYRELDRLSDACASLLASLGVRRGDRVALFLNNCPQYVIAHFGIQKLGAIVGPCSPLFKAMELEYQLGDQGARVIIAADNLLPVIDEVRGKTALEHVLTTNYADLLPAEPAFELPAELKQPRVAIDGRARDLLASIDEAARLIAAGRDPHADAVHVAVDLDDCALMTYTSGTTGRPKGAMLSYRNALFKTAATTDGNAITHDDVLLAIAPLYHIAGMLMGIDVTVYAGATTVLLHRFDPATSLAAIEEHRITWWYAIAPMLVACMQVPQRDTGAPTPAGRTRPGLSSLKYAPTTSFGIAMTESLAGQWKTFTGGCQAHEAAYGLSETHTLDAMMPLDAVRWGTCGKPAPGVDLRIVDPDDPGDPPRAKPAGETGEIVLFSEGNFLGYWNNPEGTAKTLRNGWVFTGDMGCIDADGYLSFLGRFKEMIKVSGYSVFPEDVETMLIKHPAVDQAAVIGVADPAKGEVVKAFIVRKPDQQADAAAIIEWCRANMSPYKVPREIVFRDSLPATGAGKLLRRLLKDE